jgi:hypothetical protein
MFAFNKNERWLRKISRGLFFVSFLLMGYCSLSAPAEKISPVSVVLKYKKPTIQIPKDYESLVKDRVLEGKVTLNGKAYLIAALTYPLQSLSENIFQFLLQSEAKTSDLGWAFSPNSQVFFDNHSYRMQWDFDASGTEAVLAISFQEEPASLGELKIEGNNIIQIQLSGKYSAVVNNPGPVIQVPKGDYNWIVLTLGTSNSPARFKANLNKNIKLSSTNTPVLVAGSPLTNRLTCERQGRSLQMHYQLVDAQGNSYLPVDRGQAPKFVVKVDGKPWYTNAFEFG